MEVPTGVRSRYRVKSEGTKHWLIIDDAMKEDTGTYSAMATGGTSEARVQVDCEHNLVLLLQRQQRLRNNKKPQTCSSLLCLFSSPAVKPLKILQDLQDITIRLGQPLKLHCEILPINVPGRWYRNGQLIQSSDRITIIHRAKYHHTPSSTSSPCIKPVFTLLHTYPVKIPTFTARTH